MRFYKGIPYTLIIFSITKFWATVCLGQEDISVNPGWSLVQIKDVGSLQIPPSLEIQTGDYKMYAEEYYKRVQISTPDFIAQQRGLNAANEEAFQRYARVLLKTEIGYLNEYDEISFDITTIAPEEVMHMNDFTRHSLETELTTQNIKLIEWFPLKLEKLNGMSCFHLKYRRQLRENPIVVVDTFIFPNMDRRHTLTLSFREVDSAYWSADFLCILNSFRITNKRKSTE